MKIEVKEQATERIVQLIERKVSITCRGPWSVGKGSGNLPGRQRALHASSTKLVKQQKGMIATPYPGFRVLSKASESSPEITPAAGLNTLSSEAASSTGHALDTSNVTRDCQNVGVVRRACVCVRDGFKEPLHQGDAQKKLNRFHFRRWSLPVCL